MQTLPHISALRGEDQPEHCPLGATANDHYVRQVTLTRRRQGLWVESTYHQKRQLVPSINFWKR